MIIPEDVSLDTSVYWLNNQAGGWVHVLPPLSHRHLLCLTPYPSVAWMLGRSCRKLTRIAPDGGPVVASQSLGANVVSIDIDAALAQAPSSEWDGLVVHDPLGMVLNDRSFDRIATLTRHLAQRLGEKAFVSFTVANPYAPRRLVDVLRHRRAGVSRPASIAQCEALMADCGWPARLRRPLLLHEARVVQVLGDAGYRSSKNRDKPREKLKQWVFGQAGAQRWAPAYALVSVGRDCEPAVVDQLIERIGRAGGPTREGSAELKEYLVLSGHKAILTLGLPDDDEHDVVAILGGDSLAIERRRSEARTLEALAHLSHRLAGMVPRVLDSFPIDSGHCFVMNRVPGVTLDQESPALDRVTAAAADFLIELHTETARRERFDETLFELHILPVLQAACTRNPLIAPALTAWEAPLRRCLQALELPLVWMHGDYKIENVMYDPKSLALTGVIDWEHAMLPGLPLLDLLYLLHYNRVTRGATELDSFRGLLVAEDQTPDERALIDRYMAGLQLPAVARKALYALFFAHHIGYRLHLLSDAAYIRQVGHLIEDLGATLVQSESEMPLSPAPAVH